MRGRPPQPEAMRELSGSHPERSRPDEPKTPDSAGATGSNNSEHLIAPDFLTDAERAHWDFAVQWAPIGVLKQIDRKALAEWCVAVQELEEGARALQREGRVVMQGGGTRETVKADGTRTITTRSDIRVPNPWIRIRDSAFKRMMRAVSELGFTPVSRARLGTPGGKGKRGESKNPYAGFERH